MKQGVEPQLVVSKDGGSCPIFLVKKGLFPIMVLFLLIFLKRLSAAAAEVLWYFRNKEYVH